MKGKFPNGLRAAMDGSPVTPPELARLAGTSYQQIHRLLHGERKLTREWAKRIAPHLNVAPESLIFEPDPNGEPPPRIERVRLATWVSAGEMAEGETVMEDDNGDPQVVVMDLPPGDWIAFDVEGDSMNLVAPDGSRIFVNRKEQQLISGMLYVVSFDGGEATFKRYRSNPHRFEPMSSNPENETIFQEDLGRVRVIGRVRKVVNNLD